MQSPNMDEDFLADFNVTDVPIFARKSKPPPPPSTPVKSGSSIGNSNMDCSGMSTPSSSLLDTSNEFDNSPAVHNKDERGFGNPTSQIPTSASTSATSGAAEPMDIECADSKVLSDKTNQMNSSSNSNNETDGATKKSRSRSKSKRNVSKTPDVNLLIAGLESTHPGQLPPLPQQPHSLPIPPPPPPPPPLPSTDSGDDVVAGSPDDNQPHCDGAEAGSDRVVGVGKKNKNKKIPKIPKKTPSARCVDRSKPDRISREKDKETTKENVSSGRNSSQRTTERTSKISSHNRQWRADGGDDAGSSHTRQQHQDSNLPSEFSSSSSPFPGRSTSSSAGSNPQLFSSPQSSSAPSSSSSAAFSMPSASGGTNDSSRMNPSAYNVRPRPTEKMCLDITSFRLSPEDDRRISILLRRMKGDEKDHADLTTTEKIVLHKLPTVRSDEVTGVPLEQAPGASSLYSVDDKFLSVADFASVKPRDPQIFHTITRRDSIVFVIVVRPEAARGKLAWDIPTLAQCQDFVNDFLSKIYSADDNPSWTKTYVRAGKWGRIGTILLSSESIDDLSEFRRQFAIWRYKNMAFDTYPKDVLTAKADVYILLRASMKAFNTEIIPKVLFSRNPDHIAGSLRVLATRFFAAEEKSHKGESKEHWRSIELKGCEQFMRCLRFIPENHAFLLGYDSVQIRGGLRPISDNIASAGTKRPWADTPAPAVPLLQDPRNIFPSGSGSSDDSSRGPNKRGRSGRGSRRGQRGRASRK